MAAFVQGKANHDDTAETSVAVTLDATPTNGNKLYCVAGSETDFATPSGWAKDAERDYAGFQTVKIDIFSKTVSGDSATVTFTKNVGARGGIVVFEVSGAGTLNIGTYLEESFSDETSVIPGITSSGATALHVIAMIHGGSFAGDETPAAPAGYTMVDATVTEGAYQYAAYKAVNAGATGDQTADTGLQSSAIGVSLLIDNAGGGGATLRRYSLTTQGVG
jgi:hypothetical protein